MNGDQAGMVTLGATQGIMLFTTLMPDRSRIWAQTPDPTLIRDCRNGEMMAGTLTLAFAGFLSYLTKSLLPLAIGVATTTTMVVAYELTLAQNG